MKLNTIYHGNCLNVLKTLPSECIDCIITSPPYNVGIDYNDKESDKKDYQEYLDFSKSYLEKCYDVLKHDGRLCLNLPLESNKFGRCGIYAEILTITKEIGFQYNTTILWDKKNVSNRTAWGSWLSASSPSVIQPMEVILVLYKRQWKKDRQGISTISKQEFLDWTIGVWTFGSESKTRIGHPAPFPEELPERCIKLFTYENDVILDPFFGSGTTGLVALKHNRKFIGIELNQEYIDIAMKRLDPYLYQTKLAI